jgi:HEAT repeat protein
MYREMALIPYLIQALGDKSLAVQKVALDALTEWNSAAMLALEHALLDPSEAVRVGAATALLRIQDPADLPRRLLLLPEVASETKALALEALQKAHYPLPAPVSLCRDLLGDPDPAVCQSAEEVLHRLEPPTQPQRRAGFFGRKSK